MSFKNLSLIYAKDGRVNRHAVKRDWWKKKNLEHIYDEIFDYSKSFQNITLAERIFLYVNQIDKPLCSCCGTEYVTYSYTTKQYRKYCGDCGLVAPESRELAMKHFRRTLDDPISRQSRNKKFVVTSREHWGCDHPAMSSSIKRKVAFTNKQKFGGSPLTNPKCIEKRRQTNIQKYGVDHPSKLPETNLKRKLTCIQKYGVENVMGVPEIAEKSRNSFKKKIFVLPSGKTIKLQGYEPMIAEKLLSEFGENDIGVGPTEVPKITYVDADGKSHRYYADFFIRSLNSVIEVKSDYLLYLLFDETSRKLEATIENGYAATLYIVSDRQKRRYDINIHLLNENIIIKEIIC
jgi:hypothetical protein